MEQQLDFLKNIPQTQRRLSTSTMGYIILSSFGLFFMLSIGFYIYNSIQQSALIKISTAQQNEALTFQKLAQTYPLLTSDTPLVTKVTEFEQLLKQKKAEFETLTHTTSRTPFSNYLKTLAATVPAGVWLNHFLISQETGNINIGGNALNAQYITVFIQKIQNESPFNQVIFDLFSVKKDEKSQIIKFTIANDKLLNEKDTSNASAAD